MSFRRQISWNSALRDLKDDRTPRSLVREESAGQCRAWRGVSGTRYVAANTAAEQGVADTVVLAVRRAAGTAPVLLAVAAFNADAAGFSLFRREAHMLGATELLVHRLCASADARRAAVKDLLPGVAVPALAHRVLVAGGRFIRAAIMALAVATARTRRALTGETWAACLGAALKGAWALAKADRAAQAA